MRTNRYRPSSAYALATAIAGIAVRCTARPTEKSPMRVTCSPQIRRRLTGELSARSGFPVFAVAYRKSLRNRFPAANDDAWRAYRWLTSRADGGRLAIAGDSAGGYLAVATALAATRGAPGGDCPPQSALLALSPLTDATLKLERMRERGRLQKDSPFASAAVRAIGLYTASPSARVFGAGHGFPKSVRPWPMWADRLTRRCTDLRTPGRNGVHNREGVTRCQSICNTH